MKAHRRDCELLLPALVALVHGEPHPERQRILAHLRSCESCRREERGLRATHACLLEAYAGAPLLRHPRPRRASFLALSSPLWLAVAGLVLACALFAGRGREAALEGPASAPGSPRAATGRVRLASSFQRSFSGSELDDRIELVERELALLKWGSSGAPGGQSSSW